MSRRGIVLRISSTGRWVVLRLRRLMLCVLLGCRRLRLNIRLLISLVRMRVFYVGGAGSREVACYPVTLDHSVASG